MIQILEEYCLNDTAKGLLLLSMPTGSGKTYNVLKFIRENYEYFASQERKILFVTNLKKNLPVAELRQWFDDAGETELFDEHILFIDSNANAVIDHLLSVEHVIPDEFKSESFRLLRENVETLQDRRLRSNLRSVIERDIRTDQEPAFRRFITEHLKSEFRTKEDRLKVIRTDRKYQWIGRLYPSVFTDERTVLFMSIDKFLVKNSTLIEPSYNITDRLAKDALVFIDEFDATKENVLKNIIQSGVRHRTNLLDLFLNIHGHLMQSECPTSLLQESEHRIKKREEKGWPLLTNVMEQMQEKAENIFSEYTLQHTCKSHADFSENQRNFLFYDYEFHNVLDARNKRIEIQTDEEDRANWITAVEAKSDNEHGKDIRSLLYNISGFLSYFQRGISYLAENYQQLKLEDDSVLDAFPLESAVRTTLNHFRLDDSDVEFLVTNIMEAQSSFEARQKRNNLERGGFYESGFRFHDIVDSDDHDTLSKIYMYDFSRTPELFLCDVCASALVVGISATAGLQSNIGNYDLEYLKSVLGETFIDLPDETLIRLKQGFRDATKGYSQLDVRAEFIEATSKENAENMLSEMLDDPEAAKALWREIRKDLPDEKETGIDNIYKRYVRALAAWKYFVENPECRAFLCLFSKQVKPGDKKFDIHKFVKLASYIAEGVESDEPNCDIILPLGGDEYEENKDALLKSLGQGKRRFVLSTYQTIGAGQNLQYTIPEGFDPVQINDYPPRSEMDFDGLYLDCPTNLLVNVFSIPVPEESFIKYLFQLEFLVENGAIAPSTFNSKLDAAFYSYVGRRKSKIRPGDRVSLYETQAYCRFVNKNIMQAVGRICRSNMKAPVVHLLADATIKKHLNRFSLPTEVIPVREYNVLAEQAGSVEEVPDTFVEAENRATARSDRAMAYINRQLRNPWTKDSIAEWESLRNQVLRRPVLSRFENEDSRWQGAYIQLPVPAATYRYTQRGDYKHASVTFGNDEGGAEVSSRSARLSELMSIPSLKELFISRGWPTEFENCEFMVAPPVFNNIYKGALGEVCGRHLLEENLPIKLQSMPDGVYELFDYCTDDGIYVDFKLWNADVGVEAEGILEKVRNKVQTLKSVRGVFIINILGADSMEFKAMPSSDGLIHEVPFICQGGAVSNKAIEYLLKEISKCRR